MSSRRVIGVCAMLVFFMGDARPLLAEPPRLWIDVSHGKDMPFPNFRSVTMLHVTNGKDVAPVAFLYGADLRTMVKGNEQAEDLALRAYEHGRRAKYASWASIGWLLVGAVPAVLGADALRDRGSEGAGTALISGWALVFLGGDLYAGYEGNQATRYMYKTINTFNGVYASRGREE